MSANHALPSIRFGKGKKWDCASSPLSPTCRRRKRGETEYARNSSSLLFHVLRLLSSCFIFFGLRALMSWCFLQLTRRLPAVLHHISYEWRVAGSGLVNHRKHQLMRARNTKKIKREDRGGRMTQASSFPAVWFLGTQGTHPISFHSTTSDLLPQFDTNLLRMHLTFINFNLHLTNLYYKV